MLVLEKYFSEFVKLDNQDNVKPNERRLQSKTVIAPLVLTDTRKHITTDEELLTLKDTVVVHCLSEYRYRHVSMLIPEVNILVDKLLWNRKELSVNVPALSGFI